MLGQTLKHMVHVFESNQFFYVIEALDIRTNGAISLSLQSTKLYGILGLV
jgi:hypothetical protein